MDIKEEHILGDAIVNHWYYVSKGRALRRIIKDLRVAEVLDVGAGSGVFSRQLLDYGFCKSAVCVDPGYHEESIEDHGGKPIHFVKSLEQVNQRLILMMDVLEHVEDDLALLRTYSDPMPVGGHVLITVPAFQFLWSGHDVFLEHYRRYTLHQVESLIAKAGLKRIEGRYFFGSLFPAIAVMRWIQRCRMRGGVAGYSSLRSLAPPVNHALTCIHDLERMLLLPWNRLAGLTVFCLAVKE